MQNGGEESQSVALPDPDGGRFTSSPTSLFSLYALFLQIVKYTFNVVALDLDDPLFDRTAGTAHRFELLAHQSQGSGINSEPFNQRDAFTFSTLGLTGDSNVTITGW